jgi:hypothetical protein
MDDIVSRLRSCCGAGDPECNCVEAADEIERLRAALEDVAYHAKDATPDQLVRSTAAQTASAPLWRSLDATVPRRQ